MCFIIYDKLIGSKKTMNKYVTLTYLHVHVHIANRCRNYINIIYIYILTFINIGDNFLYITKLDNCCLYIIKGTGKTVLCGQLNS